MLTIPCSVSPASLRGLLCGLLLVSLAPGCSAIVDFDRGKINPADGSVDGTVGEGGNAEGGPRDGGPDAGDAGDAGEGGPPVDAGDGGPDADAGDAGDAGDGGPCDPVTHAGCGDDELCCGPIDDLTCQPTGPSTQCSACGMECESGTASSCMNRTCVCGSEPACEDPAPRCDASMGSCVECVGDADCEGDGQPYCVAGVCSACDPGPLATAADDRGCSNPTPICGAGNTCEGCSDSPDNCPQMDGFDSVCVVGAGCFGCDPDAPIGSNGCAKATPVCATSASGNECVPCPNNAACGTGLFCDNVEINGGGGCHPCDPDNNFNCSGATPLCEVNAATGDASCLSCDVATKNCGNGTRCQDDSAEPRFGECVECLIDGQCDDDVDLFVCDAEDFVCRGCEEATEDDDCGGATPACDESTGRCVECDYDGDCAGRLDGRTTCNTSTFQCVECLGTGVNADCIAADPTQPTCASNSCRACANDADCGGDYCDESSGACYSTCDPNESGAGAGCDQANAAFCIVTTPGVATACVGCDDDAVSCPTGVCHTGGTNRGQCLECFLDEDCGGSTPVCDVGQGACVACLSNDDCYDVDSDAPYCNTSGTPVCQGCNQAPDGNAVCAGLASAGDVCATSGTSTGACGACDPGDHAGTCDAVATEPFCDDASLTCAGCGGAGAAFCDTLLATDNAACQPDGSCDCATGYTGADCDQCAAGYYGNGGATCTACPTCGMGEQCHDGTGGTGDCYVCGDGSVDGPEVCDDGNTDACGQCDATCGGAGTGADCLAGAGCTSDDDCANSCDLGSESPGVCL